ncbi:MAG: phosphomannomutase/phosphoglucomutase [Legionella sp.]|uniref:phosphomannomutase/phosphoglucomutase n=1 Tax=Legionella sp. TaxID=459 RepID=UPI0039E2F5A8
MIYQQKQIPSCVFRACDIRGIIDQDFDEHSFYSIALAIAYRLQELQRHQVFLARDGRLTSTAFAVALKQGLLESGIDVVDLGEVATPVMYYATQLQKIDCGLMVTGSHNLANYNGLKMVFAGKTLVKEDIEYLYRLIVEKKRNFGQGKEIAVNLLPQYIQHVQSGIKVKRPLKIVVDCGNGIAGPIVPAALTELGCEVIPLYCEVDGHFPNHHPDPAVAENLIDLQAAVTLHKADMGLAFDGDADRLGLVTDTGEVIWPDRLMMLYAREILQQIPGATVVFDVKCSGHLTKEIQAAGGVAKMCPTGHSIVQKMMKAKHAALAGEMSGHIFFGDRWYGFDDALYSACRLLEIISASHLTVSEQFALIPNSVNTPELKIAIPEDRKFQLMQRFYKQAQFSKAKIIDIDGLRAEFEYGWGLVRASNTTANLVTRFEAIDNQHLLAIQELFREQLLMVDSTLKLPF